jgi:Ni,Fe-hydrogenase III large subunit
MYNIFDSFEIITGIHKEYKTENFIKFIQDNDSIKVEFVKDTRFKDIVKDIQIPIWLLRHSLGVSGLEEDYSGIDIFSIEDIFERRRIELKHSLIGNSSIRNLFYKGLNIPVNENSYSHAVGPIHAGVIEPGHFRFSVSGEYIDHLTIRLGFQHRNIIQNLKGKNPLQVMSIAESICSDSTIAYSTAFANIYEEACQIEIPDEIKLIRMAFLEIERIAIHIGDIGAIAGDIGYYPLLGLCATDRGVPLGVMEALTGSRFGKTSILPGEVKLNSNLDLSTLMSLSANLTSMFRRIEKEFYRAEKSSSIRERLDENGVISKSTILQNSFIGMVARSTGMKMDLRLSEKLYKDTSMELELDREGLKGDAWSRFYLRFLELKNSVRWLEKILPELSLLYLNKKKLSILSQTKFKQGFYYKAIEGWRGAVLVGLELNSKGQVLDAYIRDPSVLNWHALELAVRGELIGDFPLNNKSFNLSYAGFDL